MLIIIYLFILTGTCCVFRPFSFICFSIYFFRILVFSMFSIPYKSEVDWSYGPLTPVKIFSCVQMVSSEMGVKLDWNIHYPSTCKLTSFITPRSAWVILKSWSLRRFWNVKRMYFLPLIRRSLIIIYLFVFTFSGFISHQILILYFVAPFCWG